MWFNIFIRIAVIFAVFVLVLCVSNVSFLVKFFSNKENSALKEQLDVVSKLDFDDASAVIKKVGEINEKYNPFREPYNKFSKLSLSEKNEMIKQNPDYGKIICRCETVTKGEIVDALRRNPKPTTLDGIKRRTRASMGRCQGGFCYPYLVEILSEELGIPYSEVTKFGGESIINIGTTKGEIKYEK